MKVFTRPGMKLVSTHTGHLREGDVIEVWTGDLTHRFGRCKVEKVCGSVITLDSVSLSRWQRFWYYVKHPRTWKWALDIPFTPPDILVRP
jgi:hypothetical protein